MKLWKGVSLSVYKFSFRHILCRMYSSTSSGSCELSKPGPYPLPQSPLFPKYPFDNFDLIFFSKDRWMFIFYVKKIRVGSYKIWGISFGSGYETIKRLFYRH